MRILTNALEQNTGRVPLYYSGGHGCLRILPQVAARFIFNAPSSTLDEFTQILFGVD